MSGLSLFPSTTTENLLVGHFLWKMVSAKTLALSERLAILGSIFRSQTLDFLVSLGFKLCNLAPSEKPILLSVALLSIASSAWAWGK